MKVVKLTKNMLKLSPQELLIKLGAVDNKKTTVYPESVFLSKNDYKKVVSNTKLLFKQDYPYISENSLKYAVGLELLNYGPNETLKDVIKDGYVLIHDESFNSKE